MPLILELRFLSDISIKKFGLNLLGSEEALHSVADGVSNVIIGFTYSFSIVRGVTSLPPLWLINRTFLISFLQQAFSQ